MKRKKNKDGSREINKIIEKIDENRGNYAKKREKYVKIAENRLILSDFR